MRQNDIRLFNYIAKIAARKDDTVIAPNTFEGVGPLESDDSIRQEEPTDYSWVTLLFPTLGLLLIPLLGKLAKLARKKPEEPTPREKSCAEKALEILTKSIEGIARNDNIDEAVEVFSMLKKLLDTLDDECKREFLALPGYGKKKFYVYVKNDRGNVVRVMFGDPNMEIRRDDPQRRKNYRSRHGCSNPGPKWKANYWSCRMWEAKKSVTDYTSSGLIRAFIRAINN